MDNILQVLFNWQFLLFSLGIFSITFVVKKVMDFIFHAKITGKESTIWKKIFHVWDELIVQILPVLVGCLAVFIKQYPYPPGISTASGRMIFGMVAGLLSGFIYRFGKSFFTKLITTNTPSENKDELDPSEQDLISKVRDTINKE